MHKIVLIFIALVSILAVPTLAECSKNENCFDGEVCTKDLCVNVTDCESCGFDCETCVNTTECKNPPISGCDEFRYVNPNDDFTLGAEVCLTHHIFFGEVIEGHVRIDDRDFEYGNNKSDDDGSHFRFPDPETGLWYDMRYNNETKLLHVEAYPKCPLTNSCSSNVDCDDGNPCTINECDGTPLTCKRRRINWCRDGDNCCPINKLCNWQNDLDCLECQIDSDCDDGLESTLDVCSQEDKKCHNVKIAVCNDNDGKCESGCTFYSDNDCKKPKSCGDGVCDSGERCCSDCGCDEGFLCSDELCVKSNETIVSEAILLNTEVQQSFEKALLDGYQEDSIEIHKKNDSVYTYNRIFDKDSHKLNISIAVTLDGEILEIHSETKKPLSLVPLFTVGFILLFVLVLAFVLQALWNNRKPKKLQFASQTQSKKGSEESEDDLAEQQTIYYDQYGNPLKEDDYDRVE